jgi:hypothetical protein
MIVKALEIRDEGTTIPMWAIKPTADNEAQRAIIRHAGYGDHPENYVILMGAHDCEAAYNPADQRGRTRQVAHQWIKKNFDSLKDGDVVDVEFILRERPAPKTSEIQKNYCDAEWERMKRHAQA